MTLVSFLHSENATFDLSIRSIQLVIAESNLQIKSQAQGSIQEATTSDGWSRSYVRINGGD